MSTPHAFEDEHVHEGPAIRLDKLLSARWPEHSRTRLQDLVKEGHVLVNGATRKAHAAVKAGDRVQLHIPPPEPVEVRPEAIPLNVLYEDDDLIVINKQAGLVVHPAPGNYSGTLVNALLHHCASLGGIRGLLRPGIVHRLDKDTTGCLVAAKSDAAMTSLVRQFRERAVRKEYLALVRGKVAPLSGTIETLLGRHPTKRQQMTTNPLLGRTAYTSYKTLEAYERATLLRVIIKTGRTHQIRVHMAHVGYPIVGDRTYGRGGAQGPTAPRQMLHAERLAFTHPHTGLEIEFTAPIPEDMRALIRTLREESETPILPG